MLRAQPVSEMSAVELIGMSRLNPRARKNAGRSLNAEHKVFERRVRLLRLSIRIECPLRSNVPIKPFSNSSPLPKLTICGSSPKATSEGALASRPLPTPEPEIAGERYTNAGASHSAERQAAVKTACRKADSS